MWSKFIFWIELFNLPLVTLALAVCAAGSYTVFICLGRGIATEGRFRWFWLDVVSMTFGAEVWATHFIAMLGYDPATLFFYSVGRTFVSIAVAAVGGAIGFAFIMGRPATQASTLFGALVLGLTIAAMHFTGMSAMQTCGLAVYNRAFGIAGLAVAILMSSLAISISGRRGLRFRRMLATICMMTAICGMHFIAMAGFWLKSQVPQSIGAYTAGETDAGPPLNSDWLAFAIAGVSGFILIAAFAAAMTDRRIGALHTHEEEMQRYLLRHDDLTGLPNRLDLSERLAYAIEVSPSPQSFAMLFLDLDRFKPINDLFGRQIGDLLLGQVAARIRFSIHENDILARVGGDEFIILRRMDPHPCNVAEMAEQIIRSIADPFIIEGQSVHIGASIGIALYNAEDGTAEDMANCAEIAVARAKTEGGGRYCCFKPDMRRFQLEGIQLESDFREAIEKCQFVVHYQPLIECDTLELCGFEALVRWQHPIRGMVSPAEFIPFAEKSGLMNTLGLWVLETACREAATWPDWLRISVNLSPVQLRATHLVDSIRAALEISGLPVHRLELEVTESALIENFEQVQATLRAIKALGVQLAIDDFGAGYSSLSYLRRFCFDRLKIDRSFIESLETDPDAVLIVSAVIQLSHSLRLSVLAEGVETAGQLKILRQHHCDQVQGYLIGRPAADAAIERFIEADSLAIG